MLSKIRNVLKSIHKSFLPQELAGEKRKMVLFYAALYTIISSTFLTVFGQMPLFSSRGLTQLFQVGWILAFVFLVMLDYKRVLKLLGISLFIICPFLTYCLLSLIFKINPLEYQGTWYIFLSLFLFIVFGTFGKYKNSKSIKHIFIAYLAGAILYALIVFITKLRGYDLDNQIYAFGDKNSAGPIFISAAIISFYVFSKRNAKSIAARWLILAFFIVIIALSKTRSVLIVVPIVLFIFLFSDIKNNSISLIIFFAFIATLILIFAIPFLRETIIINILLNGKTDLDSITSGRLSMIILSFENFKPLLGDGGHYVDCMPISTLCSYGIIGFITLLPFLVFPFFILFYYRKKSINNSIKQLFLVIAIVYLASFLLEGYGFTGPGAKVFIFWLLVGCYSNETSQYLTNKTSLKPLFVVEQKFGNTTKKTATVVLQMILLAIPVVALSIANITFTIGRTVVDKLPSSNVVAEYIEVKDIQIDAPVDSMCIGQRITYNVKAEPINAEDKSVYWSTGWIGDPCISVDGYSGEVTALKTGTALLHINRYMIGPNGVYIQYPVKDPKDYVFDKFSISTEPYYKSFDHTENETITLKQNCTSKIYYDNYYLPDTIKVEYKSSNESIAIVENNHIRAISPGVCEIKAVVHGKVNTETINKIVVNVVDEAFVPVSSIDLDVGDSFYQYEEYEISPIFNKGASDKNYTIKVDGPTCLIKQNKVRFLSSGLGTIKIISDNNSLEKTYSINILDNSPDHFECETKRIMIGDTKNAEELGLFLVYKNGYKKIVDESDLEFDPRDLTNRAWSDRNGLIKNRTTVKAVKTGSIKLNLTSKIDKNVNTSFKIISSIYTEEQYSNLSNGIGIIVIDCLLVIAISFSLFVPQKKKWPLPVIHSIVSASYLTILGLVYGLSTFFVVTAALIMVSLIVVFAIRFLKNSIIPLAFLETPVEFDAKQEEEVKIQQLWYSIEI